MYKIVEMHIPRKLAHLLIIEAHFPIIKLIYVNTHFGECASPAFIES